ncbi:GNAT family N-acetyltransferase [Chondromyces crocatus]|uniref:GNAT family acetyltransferase n=1 Tax=Chondromyces crocatus TaxID=52 RepID=A0A0K1EDH9_CHOCO|nr:GNAT family N-acetyltransferase [Chondromyces crocatus]AKT38931.1 GNAT family acetyltransferase [Chondromyces crocatus]
METWIASRPPYRITTDPERIDLDVVHGFLHTSYWSPGLPRDVLVRAIANSVNFSLFHDDAQIGFARVVTDKATFAWLADVFVLEAHRARGLARWMVQTALDHPELTGLRRWILGTRDAHGVYAPLGFRPAMEDRYMEIRRQNPYGVVTT